MEDTSTCVQQLEGVRLVDPSKVMAGSSESVYVSALSESIVETGESSGKGSSVEEQIEQSKVQWSALAESNDGEGEEDAEVSNVKVFEELQRHPMWGSFFYKFNQGDGNTLEVGEKFAEGAQAQLFHCHIKGSESNRSKEDLENLEGREWVLKVFKKGTFLCKLKYQFPEGFLQFHAENVENFRSCTPRKIRRHYCQVIIGTLLEDGRFAFLMIQEKFDLRNLIECNMESKGGKGGGPFSKEDAESIMYQVALGVEWLHNHNIVHRDLKASNVLVKEHKKGFPLKYTAFVADYECSIGVIRTRFFRVPEILQACKDHKIRERPKVFSRAADIYGYGMICYEILIGKLLFEGHPQYDYSHVLKGEHPMLREDVDDWMRDMLVRYWQLDPSDRPTIGDVLDILITNSIVVKDEDDWLKNRCGEGHRWKWKFVDVSLSKTCPGESIVWRSSLMEEGRCMD